MSGAADGLVALGGVLNTAVEAYRANEEARVQEVKRLHSDIDEAKERDASLQTKLEEAVTRLDAELASIRQLHSHQFSLFEIAGAWFSLAAKSRVFVHRNGQCDYDNGTTMQIKSADGRLALGGEHPLSLTKSTPKRLVWEGASTITWEQEMTGGSRQVTLDLDVTKMMRQGVSETRWDYRFSLIGCDVVLVLQRSTKSDDGKSMADKDFLGVYFGLLHPEQKHGAPVVPNNVDAITCTSRIDIWDKTKDAWVHLSRIVSHRFAVESPFGTGEAILFSRFREIAEAGRNHQRSIYDGGAYTAKFRVTVTDIGLLELSRNSSKPLAPA